MALDIDTVFRDNVIKGDIHSGANEPDKAEIRALLKAITGSSSAPAVVKQTKAALDLVTPASETYGGMVLNDPDPTKNGIYYRDAAAWVKGRGFPDTFAVLTSIGGTANAITASTEAAVNPADVLCVLLLDPPGTNSSSTVTLTINGTEQQVKAASGANLANGDIIDGVGTLFFRVGSEWRQLFSSATGASFDHQGDWDGGTTYTEAQIVTGSNGNWYQLKVPSSLNDDPVSGGSGDWLMVLASAALADGAVTEPKLADALKGKLVAIAADRTALANLDGMTYQAADLMEAGRKGLFLWDGSDLSTEVAADTEQGIYVAPTGDATGASGAWVRRFDGPVLAHWFDGELAVGAAVGSLLGRDMRVDQDCIVTSTFLVPANMRVFGDKNDKPTIDASSGDFKAVSLSAGSRVEGLRIEGPGNTTFASASIGVAADGTVGSGGAAPTYLEGIAIRDCEVNGFNFGGIYLSYVSGFDIRDCLVEDNSYVGLGTLSCRNGVVRDVEVDGVGPGTGSNAYGMFFSRLSLDNIVECPRSEFIKVQRCVVRDVPIWHGFDTHGGSYIVMEDCDAYNCGRPFIITFSSDTSGGKFASKQSGFRRCRALEPYSDAAQRGQAFWVLGAVNGSTTEDYADGCFIENCLVEGYGYERTSTSQPLFPGNSLSAPAALTGHVITLNRTRDTRIVDNDFIECVGNIFGIETQNLDMQITGNKGVDWGSERENSAALRVYGNTNTGRFVNNTMIQRNSGTWTYNAEISFQSTASLTGLGIANVDNRYVVGTGATAATALGTYNTV